MRALSIAVLCQLFFTFTYGANVLVVNYAEHMKQPRRSGEITIISNVSTNIGAGLQVIANENGVPLTCTIPKHLASNANYTLGELHILLSSTAPGRSVRLTCQVGAELRGDDIVDAFTIETGNSQTR